MKGASMNNSSQQAGLELLLRDMYEALTELSLVLENENQALENTEIDKLQKAATDKERLSSQLEKLEGQRVKLLQSANVELDKASMSRFIIDSAGSSADSLTSIWEMVEELAIKCDKQNRVNGIVIENTKRQTQAALAILKGHFSTEDNLYDADGSSVSQTANSTLARA